MNKLTTFFVYCFFALLTGTVFGQGEANVWYFGTRGGLDFNSGSPVKLSNSAMNLGAFNGEGMASICNSAGTLLFYTDGTNVYDASHVLMTNGTGIAGNTSSAQTALIIPVPGSTNLYYIFSTPGIEQSTVSGTGVADGNNGLRYSIVNITTNTITNKNTLLTPAGVPVTEGQTAVPHFDGTSFWLICKQAGNKTTGASSNNFYAYRVGTNNINAGTGVINNLNGTADEVISGAGAAIAGITGAGASTNGIITIKANSCYDKLAVAFFANGTIGKRIELFNFSNSTGAISLANSITNFDAADPNEVYGIEFSPNGRFLYASIMNFGASNIVRGSLYQFDISSGVNATINAAAQRFKSNVGTALSRGLGALQLAADGKIYYTYFQNDPLGSGGPDPQYIGRITNPNVAGAGATFDDTFISFTNVSNSGVATKMGLPQVYKGFIAGQLDFGDDLPTVAGVKQVCRGASVTFTVSFTGTIKPNTLDVDWGDGNVQTNIAGTPTSLSHTYITAGNLTAIVTFEDICNNPYSVNVPIKVVPPPTGTITCVSPDKLRFDVTGTVNATSTYVWYKTAGGIQAWGAGTTLTTPALTPAFPTDVYLYEATGSSSAVTFNNNQPLDGNAGSLVNNLVINKQVLVQSFDVRTFTNFMPCTSVIATLRDASNAVVTTVTVLPAAGACGVLTIPLNISLAPGNYTITMSGTGGTLFYFTANYHRITPVTSALMDDNGAGAGAGDGPAYNFKLVDLLGSCTRVQIVAACSLPVTWLGFNGKRMQDAVLLDWSTASEQNSKVFYVQRSTDGTNFETIASVNAAGNSNTVRSYSYTDDNAPLGSVYYRLLQEDIDGASTLSKTVYVNAVDSFNLSLVPNPGNGSFTITGLSEDVKLNVAVYSITGQSLYTTTAHAGEVINLEGVAKGFYIVKIVSGNTEQSIRFINQ
jgi:Secretion system C-terminal sorting domain